MSTINDLFGSDSESEEEAQATSAAAEQKQFDVDELFASSDEEDEPAAKPVLPSRLKKGKAGGSKKPKAAAVPKKRLKKQPGGEGGTGSGAPPKKRARPPMGGGGIAGGAAEAGGGGGGGGDAYDSGDEVVATAEDDAFLASDDELEDVAAEYRNERQDFDDERDTHFHDSDEDGDARLAKKKQRGSKSGSSSSEKIDPKSDNAIHQAILASRRKKNAAMAEQDKRAVVTALLERMDEAWRRDLESASASPPRPALEKLAILDKVANVLRQRSLHDVLLEEHALEHIRNWLYPTEKKQQTKKQKQQQVDSGSKAVPLAARCLPSLTLRGTLYGCLATMPITAEHLKMSERGGGGRGDWPGLGKVVIMLLKHPGETAEHKRALQALLEEWSRHIFKRPKDFRELKGTLRESDRAARQTAAGLGLRRQDSGAEVEGDLDETHGVGGEVDTSRVVRPYRVGFDFKVKPKAQELKPAKLGRNQQKKAALAVKLKEQQRKVKTGSQRGEAPSHKVDA